MRVAFVYHNSRGALEAEVSAGRAPDSTLLGENHLRALGIDAFVHDPWLTRKGLPRRFARIAWNARELMVPFEIRRADAIFTPMAAFMPLAARLRGLPTVVVNYGLCLIYDRSSRPRRKLLSAVLRSASTVVCLAESQAELTRRQTGAHVTIVPLGIDERFWSPAEGGAREPLVVGIGRDLARDFGTLAQALRSLEVPSCFVAFPRNLVGVDLPENAKVVQGVPWAELRELYARAGCLVIPQYPDSYPYGSETGGLTSLLEAWAMAKPVVVSDRSAMRDYVDEETALVVPPGDPAACREAIERVLGDPELAASLGAAGRRRVEERHTTRQFAERIAPLLREAAA